ncbi:MAG: hypothetical protein R2798_10295 [Chitinophagales bacterium]
MLTYTPNIPLISIHIPKTAGTSFKKILENWYPSRLYNHYSHRSKPKKVRLRAYFSKNYRKNICINGHFNNNKGIGVKDYYPEWEELQYICFVRNSLSQAISNYNYIKKRIETNIRASNTQEKKLVSSIDYYLNNYQEVLKNYLPFAINLNNYKQLIEKHFVHLGCVEKFSQSIQHLGKKLNKPIPENLPTSNALSYDINPSPEVIAAFKEKIALDYAIWELAMQLND